MEQEQTNNNINVNIIDDTAYSINDYPKRVYIPKKKSICKIMWRD
jgi:hypothetical protein